MIATVEMSHILKRFNVLNQNYGKKFVRVILLNGGKGIYECLQIDG